MTTTSTTTTMLVCGAGEYVAQSTFSSARPYCSSCRYGTFQEEDSHSHLGCNLWTKCNDNEHEVEKATDTQNYVCATTTECASGEYEYRRPIAGKHNRQCKPITPCLPGEYVYKLASYTQDQRCRRCDQSKTSYDGGLCTSTT